MADAKRVGLFALPVKDVVTAAINHDRTFGAHDDRTAISIVKAHSLAGAPLPRNQFVRILKVRDHRVGELPIILELVAAAACCHGMRNLSLQSPAADVYLMRAVVERLAGAIAAQPVPVVGMNVVLVLAA